MAVSPDPEGGRYDWFGWRVGAVPGGVAADRLVETHEYFHRQLDDLTAFGGLTTTVAALADARPRARWADVRDRLQAMSDLVHESFAVGMSLLTTQRSLAPIDGYPVYDRHVATVLRLLGADVHPWVALAALRAAATTCMQLGALAHAVQAGLADFRPGDVERLERPNHRLVALLTGGYATAVASALEAAWAEHGQEPWWQPAGEVLIPPQAMERAGGRSVRPPALRQAGSDGHL